MKIQAIKINDKDYNIKCPFCKLDIIGYNKKLMEENMMIHIKRKHLDLFLKELKEVKNG